MRLAHFEDADGFVRSVTEGDTFYGPNGEKLVAMRYETCEDDDHEQEEASSEEGG